LSKRPVTKSPIITLQPKDGSRMLAYIPPPGIDRIYVSPSGTTADISKVRIVVDDGDVLDLSEFVPADITPPKKIVLEWDPSQDGKTIQFLFGRDYYRRAITYAEIVRSWDIAPKLDIISALVLGLTASDYNIISLDLSVARTEALIASNVVSLKILESTTSTALYTLKLFNTAKPGLTQDVLPPGSLIERLRRANVYVSNTAQATGTRLDILVFQG
jgi:hypothetical protein